MAACHQELIQALESSYEVLETLASSPLGTCPLLPSCDAFSPYAKTPDCSTPSTSAGSPEKTSAMAKVDRRITILRLYHTPLVARLSIDILHPERRESAFDDLEPALETMRNYCEQIIEPNIKFTRPLLSSTSGLGYAMPLHTIAARCRFPQLRRRVLGMLRHSGNGRAFRMRR